MVEEQEHIPLASPPVNKQQRRQWLTSLLLLLIPGISLELLYLLIVALSPLPQLHLYSTPLPTVWPWTVAPSRLLFPGFWSAPTKFSLQVGLHLLLALTLIALVGIYILAIIGVWRLQRRGHVSARLFLLVLAGTAVFGLTLLFQPALFSDDVFTYIFSGRILAIYHADPINTAPFQFPQDTYLQWVLSGRNAPNIYGQLWLTIASVLASIGQGLGPLATLLLFKGVALLSHLGNCLLVWAILGTVAPTRRLLGTLLYAWNPLILLELAGSGHSEGVVISLLLLATLLYVRGKRKNWWREVGVLILFGLATSTNLIVLLLAPLYVWFVVRSERSIQRALLKASWRICVILGCTLLISLPFWRGPSTFFAITSAVDTEHFIHSPMGALAVPLRWIYTLVAQVSGFPPVMQPVVAADVTVRASATFIFALIYFHLFSRVRQAPIDLDGKGAEQQVKLPGLDVLLNSWSIALFWYITLVSGWFWPWYVLWVLWSIGLRRLDALTISLLLLSSTALLTYPLLDFANAPIAIYEPVFIFGIPLLYLLINKISGLWGGGDMERMVLADDR